MSHCVADIATSWLLLRSAKVSPTSLLHRVNRPPLWHSSVCDKRIWTTTITQGEHHFQRLIISKWHKSVVVTSQNSDGSEANSLKVNCSFNSLTNWGRQRPKYWCQNRSRHTVVCQQSRRHVAHMYKCVIAGTPKSLFSTSCILSLCLLCF